MCAEPLPQGCYLRTERPGLEPRRFESRLQNALTITPASHVPNPNPDIKRGQISAMVVFGVRVSGGGANIRGHLLLLLLLR